MGVNNGTTNPTLQLQPSKNTPAAATPAHVEPSRAGVWLAASCLAAILSGTAWAKTRHGQRTAQPLAADGIELMPVVFCVKPDPSPEDQPAISACVGVIPTQPPPHPPISGNLHARLWNGDQPRIDTFPHGNRPATEAPLTEDSAETRKNL